MCNIPKIIDINGPVVKADSMGIYKVRDMVLVGDKKLIGEIISIDEDVATIQVYEETQGLKVGETIESTNVPLSVTLGPGIIGNIFDGIQRPLEKIYSMTGEFIAEGIGLVSIDKEKQWDVEILVKVGDKLSAGEIFATTQETSFIEHKILVPPTISGEVIEALPSGKYNLETDLVTIKDEDGKIHKLKMYHQWPVRIPRPIDVRKGGTSALPGGFGTGKTMTQHQLAKWSDADIIVYIGCGERGNEMTDVLEEFPKLIDPRTSKPLMERTILIANTSNMPVAAREASIYTGITIAEYYRDMGYHVAIMADSTSRWAEALREISGRLEEMPAEEGYPAYLPSRIAQFYERAGYVETLSKKDGSITVIGAVSPPGGDFSEPVTENTKRFFSAFIGLDKNLAYIRHYPAVNYLTSYSGYTTLIKEYYDENVSPELLKLRAKMMELLSEDNKLNQIVQLVGEDVLPNDQRIVIEIAKVIDNLYMNCTLAVKQQVALTRIKNDDLFEEVIKMKYNIPNENYDEAFEKLNAKINSYYTALIDENQGE